jgi:3-phosphoshikimate 1-carboxyvinyltransferase
VTASGDPNPPGTVTVGGAAPLRGRLRVPGDKSISHRALLFAALAGGDSTIRGLAGGDDVRATAAVIAALGVRCDVAADGLVVHGGGADGLREPADVLDCANSGTTMRTIAGVLAARPFLAVLTGDASLRTRPMGRIVVPLRAMGARIDGRDDGDHAPLVVRGGPLVGMTHTVTVASAQVKTALVLAGLQAEGATEVVSPGPSRDHTERMLAALGAPVEHDGLRVRVRAGSPRAFELDVPGDPSSAAFWCVAATVTPGSDLTIESVGLNPTRIGFVDVLRRMGASIDAVPTGEQQGEPVGDLHVRAAPLVATNVGGDEISLVQDEVPVLAVAAAFADGVSEITDAAELRVKESDRIATVEALLTALGVGVETSADGLAIRGGRPRAGRVESHGDHRIALAGAVAGHALDGATAVTGFGAASVSYPEFLDDLAALTGATE